MQQNHMQKKDRKKRLIIAIIIIVVLIAAAAAVLIAYRMGQSRSTGNDNANGVVLDDNASEWNQDLEDLSGGQSGIKIPGYGSITVPAGASTWQITLANPEGNNCYFQYSITIDDSETPVYESDYIEPGKAITEFEVSEPLEAGEYEIHLNIATYSMDGNNTRMNGADVTADLHVVE